MLKYAVCFSTSRGLLLIQLHVTAHLLPQRGTARQGHRPRRQHSQVSGFRPGIHTVSDNAPLSSPGFMDIQINGAYNFDFSIFQGDKNAYREGLKDVARRMVETGVTG